MAKIFKFLSHKFIYFQSLPEDLKSGQLFTVCSIFWNLGINHEATFAQSIAGDCSLEETINIIAGRALQAYADCNSSSSQSVKNLIAELNLAVNFGII